MKDRTIAHAIIDAYSEASIKERSPEVHLFIEMPPDAVDVNVHPTKAEVRFREQSLHPRSRAPRARRRARPRPAPELQLERHASEPPQPSTLPLPHAYARSSRAAGLPAPARRERQAPSGDSTRRDRPAKPAVAPDAHDRQRPVAPTIRPMMPLGQFRDTFIIAIDDEGIAIIDQHVAHERVLFERIIERLTSGRLESQRLLEPMLLELPPRARQALLSHARRARASRVRDRGVRRRHACA